MTDKLKGREVIFEMMPIGSIMRVSAMDAQTLIEVVVQCPTSIGELGFKRHALQRLEYVLRKKGVIS